MKLAFFGSHHAFNYHHIGGTDSLVRRLSLGLVKDGLAEVDLLTYGDDKRRGAEVHSVGLRSLYYHHLTEAFDALRDYDHVIVIYLPARDRLKLMQFRTQVKNRVKFHMLFQSWPDSAIKRWLMFLDARLMRFNGGCFAVSPRLVKFARQLGLEATLLWPPVPVDYFVPLPSKASLSQIRVTFLGRVDPGKGVIETIELFNALSRQADVKLSFVGMHWPHDPKSVHLHQKLLLQERFPYTHVGFTEHSPAVEDMVRTVLRDTDIFIQPYRKLSSTIDTPLLLLEAMASLAAVFTKPYGVIPRLYGESLCLLHQEDFYEQAIDLVLSAKDWLPAERQRIARQNDGLLFDVDSVVANFAQLLKLD